MIIEMNECNDLMEGVERCFLPNTIVVISDLLEDYDKQEIEHSKVEIEKTCSKKDLIGKGMEYTPLTRSQLKEDNLSVVIKNIKFYSSIKVVS